MLGRDDRGEVYFVISSEVEKSMSQKKKVELGAQISPRTTFGRDDREKRVLGRDDREKAHTLVILNGVKNLL